MFAWSLLLIVLFMSQVRKGSILRQSMDQIKLTLIKTNWKIHAITILIVISILFFETAKVLR